MLSKDFREPLSIFEFICFRNSICVIIIEYRIVKFLNIRFWACRSLRGKSHFSVSLGIAEILGFSDFLVFNEVLLLKNVLKCFESYFYYKL